MPHSPVPGHPVLGSAVLTNEVGLHARPSVKLTQLAKSFSAAVEIALAADGPWVDAKSPVKVMRVKAPRGATLHVRATGADASAAASAILSLVERRFDEDGVTEAASP
jgi:phosphocarrier protein HPr